MMNEFKIKKWEVFFLVFMFVSNISLVAQPVNQETQKQIFTEKQKQLRVTASDIRLIPEKGNEYGGGGFHLWMKKVPGVNSILLTETTKDPLGKNDSYAYRAKEYNPVNGDEIRYLDGKPLVTEFAKYSLVDSTTEKTTIFGGEPVEAFHIYIPSTLVYGYEWSRKGEVEIGKGTFINIRTFEKPYADYSGDYFDCPFMFDLVTKKRKKPAPKPVPKPKPEPKKEPEPEPEPIVEPVTVLTDDYNPIASEKFKELDKELIYSKGPETIIEDIRSVFESFGNLENLDVVLAIDATGSMKNDIDTLKKDLQPLLEDLLGSGNTKARVGLLFYRDYGDTYKYMDLPVKMFAFSSNLSSVCKNLQSIRILGTEGGDIPEAVYEAMYASCEFYKWRSDAERQVILIGDAEPHPTPRGTGKYSKEYVTKLAAMKGIKVHTILLPKD